MSPAGSGGGSTERGDGFDSPLPDSVSGIWLPLAADANVWRVYYVLIHGLLLRTLLGGTSSSLGTCMYFSAQTFPPLGFGDLLPGGPVRMLAVAEASNDLLLIGWSGPYTDLSMERFWNGPGASGS